MIHLKKTDIRELSTVLVAGAVIAVVLAVIGAVGQDIWLASTQWLLIAAVLVGLGIYLKP